ncbi:hypothetical protein SAMN04487914_10877 [Arthrobacter sp. ok909]|uniref:hypothetical protein n=1 Tax=Arthrobacter sp. ok909 TaxID=1761746 RepID=UPI00088AE8C1|nr:hypothetical protein [Arthrobacter sp. ok909]SDP32990.1 hypothetical protein SAMN04487914_10877 [Arthrobacter sp. ok909]
MINKAELTPEKRIIKELADMRRDIEAMKAKQLLGADNMNIVTSSQASLTTVYTAGMVGGVVFNIYAGVKRLYLAEVKSTFYIDNDLNPNYAWPYGASINPNMLDVSQLYDLAISDELGAGNKSYVFRIENTSAISHTVYMHLAVVYPAQTLSLT